MKVFAVIITGYRPLAFQKLTLSHTVCFKNSAKTTTLYFRECLINVQLRSVLLVMPVMERNKLQNFIFL